LKLSVVVVVVVAAAAVVPAVVDGENFAAEIEPA
jgi:hypothetical protein